MTSFRKLGEQEDEEEGEEEGEDEEEEEKKEEEDGDEQKVRKTEMNSQSTKQWVVL